MARIVTTQFHYKRPPRKKRPVMIEVPEVVAVHRRKRIAKADQGRSVHPGSEAASSVAPTESPAPANDDRKAAIVTAKTPREIQLARRRAKTDASNRASP
jgi:hypothetical protein